MPRLRRLSPILGARRLHLAAAVLAALLVGGLALLAIPADAQQPEGLRYHGLFRIRLDETPEPDETIQIIELPDAEFEQVTDETRVRASELLRMPAYVPEGLGEPSFFGVAQGDFFFHAGVGYSNFPLHLAIEVRRILAIPIRLSERTDSLSVQHAWTVAGRESILVNRLPPGLTPAATILRVIDGDVMIVLDATGVTVDDLVQVARSLLPAEDVALRPSWNPITYLGRTAPIAEALGTAASAVSAIGRLITTPDGAGRWELWSPQLPAELQAFGSLEYSQPYIVVATQYAAWQLDPTHPAQPWRLWSPLVPAGLTTFDRLEFGASYLVLADAEVQWSFPRLDIR